MMSPNDGGEDTVTLVANDGSRFPVSREVASKSPTLCAMLNSPFMEKAGEITLSDMDGRIVSKVVEYLKYCEKAEDDDSEFQVPPEMSLELLLAADYLNI